MDVLPLLGAGMAAGLGLALAVWLWWRSAALARHRSRPAADRQMADLIEGLRADHAAHLRDAVATLVAVAGDRLGAEHRAGAVELDRRSDAIGQQLASLNAELGRVGAAVAGLRQDRAHQHGEVVAGLQQTLRASSEVATTARSLREALSSSRARGQWGERMADDVLRLAGFTEGISYHRQRATADGTVPDFSFPLPGGLALHMDVKFPLDNYLRYLDGREDQARTQFLRDVRARVRELGGRGYIRPGETVDYVLLFIPNEAVYGFVHEQDPALADFALGQRVVLCSPFTLFAVLAVVRQATDSFALQRSTDDILRTLGRFAAQWEKFSEQLEVLGRRLDLTQRAYEDLAGTRRRQLQRMVDAVDELRRTRGIDALPEVEADAVAAGAPEPVPLRRDLNDAEEMPRPGASIRDLARRLTG